MRRCGGGGLLLLREEQDVLQQQWHDLQAAGGLPPAPKRPPLPAPPLAPCAEAGPLSAGSLRLGAYAGRVVAEWWAASGWGAAVRVAARRLQRQYVPREPEALALGMAAVLGLRVRMALRTWIPGLVRGLAQLLGVAASCPGLPHLPRALLAGSPARLLPPPTPSEERKKLCVVLDLDETLVCTYNSTAVPAELQEPEKAARTCTFEMSCAGVVMQPGEVVVGRVTSTPSTPPPAKGGPQAPTSVIVYKRPKLEEFLRRASEFCELVLFTAGLESYALPLTSTIDPEKHITARLYRRHCVSTATRDNVKDLGRLGRPLERTVLIDNNPFSFCLQPQNGIPIQPFDGDPDDDVLLTVILPLLEALSEVPDVRPFLAGRFRMEEWFAAHGAMVPGAA